MMKPSEETTETIVNGDDILELARKCPLVLPVGSDETVISVLPKNRKSFKLKQLYGLLDCHTVEVIYFGETGMIGIIDEEGTFKGPQNFNEFATILWRHHDEGARSAGAHLYGKVLICADSCFQ